MSKTLTLPARPKGVLIDVAGVLHNGNTPVPGAQAALMSLREAGLQVRFLTNTTSCKRATIVHKLHRMGFDVGEDEVFTAVHATRRYVESHRLHPFWLVHPAVEAELPPMSREPDAVVLGDAGPYFSFGSMNAAFRHLMRGVPLIAMARNRYFQEGDGPTIDMGAFVAALEFAAGVQATVVGKPSASFFQGALNDMGVSAADAVMIGDDIVDDVQGGQLAGVAGILVRTGKYRHGDESAAGQPPVLVADHFVAAVQAVLGAAMESGVVSCHSLQSEEVSHAH